MLLLTFVATSLYSCGGNESGTSGSYTSESGEEISSEDSSPVSEDKDISIIYTTVVHCGVDTYLGYVSLLDYKKEPIKHKLCLFSGCR